jgi:uncharacterized protein YejL (UPF0352 family)
VTEDVNPKYERREGEDAYEYGLRLIATKVEEQPEDLDWQDIVEALGLDCHRDSLRKAAAVTPYSGYAVMQHFKKKLGASSDTAKSAYLDEIEAKTMKMRKEAKRFYDQRREFNKLVDKLGREENLEDRLVAAARELNESVPLAVDKDREYLPCDDEAVLVLADWHYGMVTNNIWQHYDTDVCRERVETLVDAVIDRLRLHRPKRLHVVLLGDMAHGAIHTSVRVASEELVCEQVMQVSEIIARAIAVLADEVEETVVHATYGNHLRTVQNKKDSIHADNMERLIPWWLEQRLGERSDVTFPEAEYYEFLYFDVCGYHVCATHGDLDNVRSAGRTLNTLFQKKYGTGIDYVLLADKHHKEEFEELGVEAMIVRALCGVDDYANDKRLYSTPGQLLMFFRSGVGADATYQIRL